MDCLNNGTLRPQLVHSVEQRMETFLQQHSSLLDAPTPDDFTESLMSALVDETQKLFHKKAPDKGQQYEEFKKLQHELLGHRRTLKERIQEIPDAAKEAAELEYVQTELKNITKLLAKARREHWKGRQNLLNDETHEAWANRNMKEAYKLLQLAG